MPKQQETPEEILQHRCRSELETGNGLAVRAACRKLGITEHPHARWTTEYGRLRVEQVKRLTGLEQEPLRRQRTVDDPALDLSLLTIVASGHFSTRPARARPWGTPSPCAFCEQ